MNNAVNGKTINVKCKKYNWCKACKQWKRLFTMDIKTKVSVTKKFDNGLVAIRKSQITLINICWQVDIRFKKSIIAWISSW